MNKHKKAKRLVAIMLVFTMIFSLFSMTPASASVVEDNTEYEQMLDDALDELTSDDEAGIAVQAESEPSEQVTTTVEGLNNIKNDTVRAAVEKAFTLAMQNDTTGELTQDTITGLNLSTVNNDEWFSENVIGGRLNINDIWPLFPELTWINVDSTNITSIYTNYSTHIATGSDGNEDPTSIVIEGQDGKELVVHAPDTFAISEEDGGRHVIFDPKFIAEGLGEITDKQNLEIDMYDVFQQLRFARLENGEYVAIQDGIKPYQYDGLFASIKYAIRTAAGTEETMATGEINI
jgi:hypothetical protein